VCLNENQSWLTRFPVVASDWLAPSAAGRGLGLIGEAISLFNPRGKLHRSRRACCFSAWCWWLAQYIDPRYATSWQAAPLPSAQREPPLHTTQLKSAERPLCCGHPFAIVFFIGLAGFAGPGGHRWTRGSPAGEGSGFHREINASSQKKKVPYVDR